MTKTSGRLFAFAFAFAFACVLVAGCTADGRRDDGRAGDSVPPPPPVATIPNAGNPLRRDRPADVLRDTSPRRGPAELELDVGPDTTTGQDVPPPIR